MNPLYAGAAGALVLMGVFGLGYHFGSEACRLDDAKATVSEMARNQKQESTDVQRINAEATQLGQAVLDPLPAPVVRVCLYTPAITVPGAPTPGPESHAAPASRGADPLPARAGPDIGEPLVRVGHDSDAQVIALQDYITHVCRVPSP